MPDGTYSDYHANNLLENIFNTVDDDGRIPLVMDEILDHRKIDRAIPTVDGWTHTPSGATKE